MKKYITIILFIAISLQGSVEAQSQEAKQLLLDVTKLASLKNILTDLKKAYGIISSGYNSIRNIAEGNFNLHETFLNSLLQVSPSVKKYQHVIDILTNQFTIVKEYKSAFGFIKLANLFSSNEIDYIGKVYTTLLEQSGKNLDDLVSIVTAGKLRMTDDERLHAIDEIWKNGQNQLAFLRQFDNSAKVLGLQRTSEQHDVSTFNKIYDNH